MLPNALIEVPPSTSVGAKGIRPCSGHILIHSFPLVEIWRFSTRTRHKNTHCFFLQRTYEFTSGRKRNTYLIMYWWNGDYIPNRLKKAQSPAPSTEVLAYPHERRKEIALKKKNALSITNGEFSKRKFYKLSWLNTKET